MSVVHCGKMLAPATTTLRFRPHSYTLSCYGLSHTTSFHTYRALRRPLAETSIVHRKSLANQDQAQPSAQCLSRLPTMNLLRNIILGAWFSSPLLFKPGLSIMRTIANSHSPILNPDKNPLIGAVVKLLIYNHFCAGTNKKEIDRTKVEAKQIGFSGIILCYGRETGVGDIDASQAGGERLAAEVAQWRDGNLQTIDMIGRGDWLGMK
jgi:proline dehydrogenase